MIRIPHRLCQAVAWAFSMCDLNTPEVALSRGFQEKLELHHLLVYHIVLLSCIICPTGFPITFCHSWSLVFSFSKLKSSSPQISLKSSLSSLGTVPRIFLYKLCECCDIRDNLTHLGTEKALSIITLWLDTTTIAMCSGKWLPHRLAISDPTRDFAFNGRP